MTFSAVISSVAPPNCSLTRRQVDGLGLKVDDPVGCCSLLVAQWPGRPTRRDHRCGAGHVSIGTPGMSIVDDMVITRGRAWFTDSVQPMLYSSR